MASELMILKKPLITEKGTHLQEELNQYSFEVDPNANKIQIKKAVEARFDVTVTKVRTLKIPGKMKTLGRFTGRRPDRKKAIVTLAKDDKIEYVEGV